MPRPRAADLAGLPPRLAQTADATGPGRASSAAQVAPERAARAGGINLRAVAEVLAAEGMDPTAELVRILRTPRQKVTDPETGVTQVVGIDDDTRTRVLTELLGYVQPKLKAVELRVMPGDGMTDEQLQDRVRMLLARASSERGE